jgi:hypothetical protein
MPHGISFPSARITNYALRAALSGVQLTFSFVKEMLRENSPPGTLIGTLATTGTIGIPQFALIDDAGGRVALAGPLNETVVAGLVPADFEATPFFNFTVSVIGVSPQLPNRMFTVEVIDINEFAPVIISNGGAPAVSIVVVENTTAVTTVVATDADVGDVVTYAIVGGADANSFSINSATGELSFAAPPDYENPTDTNDDNQYEVIVAATDGEFVTTQSITVLVTDIFDPVDLVPPVITSEATIILPENTPLTHTLTADEPVTWAIIGGADYFLFTLAGDILSLTAKDFENPIDQGANNTYTVQVRATDLRNNTSLQTITVVITAVNEHAPVIISGGGLGNINIAIPENLTTVTTIVATDADNDPITYSISGGLEASFFTIDPVTGVLSFISPPDFEDPLDHTNSNSYHVVVMASDGVNYDVQSIIVFVTNVDEVVDLTPPVITSPATVNLPENSPLSHTLVANEGVTWTKIGGADASLFTLAGSTLTLAAKDYENPVDSGANNTYVVQVRATDLFGNYTDQTFTAIVTAVNEFAPVISSNGGGPTASVTLAENTVTVTTVVATDADGDTVTYSIVPVGSGGGADAPLFAIHPLTGALVFTTSPDFEAPGSSLGTNVYQVTVQASDGTLTDTQAITVTVTDAVDGSAPSLDFSDPNNSMYIPGIL